MEKLCHYLFSQFCWRVLYCLFSLVACFWKQYSRLFSKFIQIFIIIEIGFCAPKAYICYLSVSSFTYLASPEFGCRGEALSWEYQLDPVPGFSLQVDIAVQAENRDWECCPLQRCSSRFIVMPKISEERPLLQWILFSSSRTTAAAFYIQPPMNANK